MLRMFARRMSQVRAGPGNDTVMFGVSLPSDTVVHDIRVKVQVMDIAFKAQLIAAVYAVEGWILPVLDPDAAASHDTIWDALVPKDTDTDTLDLDTGASDTSPFSEPGEADFTTIMDVGLRPQRLYHRQRLLSMATRGVVVTRDPSTPFDFEWVPMDSFVVHIGRRLRVRQPSVLIFAVGSPDMDDTNITPETVLAEAQWVQMKYIRHVLDRALLHQMGVVESGAETPWEEASALLRVILEPNPLEQNAGMFGATTWQVFTEAMVDLSVVGELGKQALSSGR